MVNVRTDIGTLLVSTFSNITLAAGYSQDVKDVSLRLRFLDEIDVFPAIYITAGNESRTYHPGYTQDRVISFLVRVYVNEENAHISLNSLIDDIELALNTEFKATRLNNLVTNIVVSAITTDEGILDPEGVAEIELLATVNQTF